nr:hypothetical protein B0A51_15395 [Rachicladosporium sp. CCFEE 5018]
MPGVPSGLGCDACRKQKKKCDTAKPACGRCERLDLTCNGALQKRYKFKQLYASETIVDAARANYTPPNNDGLIWAISIASSPATAAADSLRLRFLATIVPSTDFKHNLAWSYGPYLQEVPRRLGVSPSMDAAIEALVHAHHDICQQKPVSVIFVQKYGKALRTLREALQNEEIARRPETLAAVMILLTCQGVAGMSGNGHVGTGHAQGAIALMRARGFHKGTDDFERVMVVSLSTSVLFEALFNPSIQLATSEWHALLSMVSDTEVIFNYLACFPELMRRGKAARYCSIPDPTLVQEARANEEALRRIIEQSRIAITSRKALSPFAAQARGGPYTNDAPLMQHVLCVLFGLGIVSACITSGIDLENRDLYAWRSSSYADEIIANLQDVSEWYPIGSGLHHFALVTAWLGTNDEAVRTRLDEEMAFVRNVTKRESIGSWDTSDGKLLWMAKELRLENPP